MRTSAYVVLLLTTSFASACSDERPSTANASGQSGGGSSGATAGNAGSNSMGGIAGASAGNAGTGGAGASGGAGSGGMDAGSGGSAGSNATGGTSGDGGSGDGGTGNAGGDGNMGGDGSGGDGSGLPPGPLSGLQQSERQAVCQAGVDIRNEPSALMTQHEVECRSAAFFATRGSMPTDETAARTMCQSIYDGCIASAMPLVVADTCADDLSTCSGTALDYIACARATPAQLQVAVDKIPRCATLTLNQLSMDISDTPAASECVAFSATCS